MKLDLIKKIIIKWIKIKTLHTFIENKKLNQTVL